jgi:hypothetical protein
MGWDGLERVSYLVLGNLEIGRASNNSGATLRSVEWSGVEWSKRWKERKQRKKDGLKKRGGAGVKLRLKGR